MDSEAGFWRREPRPELRGLVRGLYGYDERGAAMRELIEPAGLDVPLIVNFGTPFEIALGRRPAAADGIRSFAAGLFAGPVIMNSDGGAQCIQVNFTPVGGRLFYGMPLGELADRMVALDDLSDPGVTELADRLAELNSWQARLDLTERFVAGRLRRAPAIDPEAAWAYGRIESRGGNLRIRGLCSALGWSRRRLAERFRHEFGLPPKAIARIARFEAAETMALEAGRAGWADIAAACGYSDQAHLTREFSELAGRSPSAFRAAA